MPHFNEHSLEMSKNNPNFKGVFVNVNFSENSCVHG